MEKKIDVNKEIKNDFFEDVVKHIVDEETTDIPKKSIFDKR